MFALDLFNTDHERRIAEGAVDQLEQRRIDDLAMKMDDLVARAKTPAYKKNPAALAALMKEFQKCKAERDSYYKVRNETMGYGSLGEQDQIPVGRTQPGTPEYVASRNRSVKYADPKPNYAGGHKTASPATVGYKKTTNNPLVPSELEVAEADQVPPQTQPVRPGTDLVTPQQRVAGATPPSNTALGKAKETFTSFANWLAGKDDTGPTYESAVKEQTSAISPVTAAKYAYEQMRKAHDDNVDIATIRWMNNPEAITMSRNQLYHTLTRLKNMSRQNRNQFALQTLADRNNFALWLGGQKKVQTRPQLKATTDPFQTELPLGKPKSGVSVQERVQKKNSDDPKFSDAETANALRKIRAKHPATNSDLEALAKNELDYQARSDRQLAAIQGANTKQDTLLKQLVSLDQEQGREIDGLDSENNNLEAQLARIQATNDRLQNAIQSMTGTKQSTRAKQSAKAEPQTTPQTTTRPTPATTADLEVEKKIQGLEAQLNKLEQQPQSVEVKKQIADLENRINALPAKAAKALNIEPVNQVTPSKQAPRVQAPFSDLDIEPPKSKAIPKTKSTSKAKPKATPVPNPEDEFDLLNIDESVKKLHSGDPIIVTAPNEFEGKTGEIYDFAPSGTFVIVNLYNHGKHSMHLSDIEYNQYADEQEDDWYDEGVAEGWSDAMVARRTGTPRTPYSVYIKGKKWKDFENDDHAEAVANKLRAKFKAEGRDPSVITIAPTNMSEGVAEATGDSKFDAMMGKISKDPWTQLNSDPNWEYQIEELVDQHIEPWLLAMERSGMPITRDGETLNPGWRKRYEQVSTQLAQKYLTSKKFNPRDPDLVGKIRAAIDNHTDQSRNVHGQLSAYADDLPMQRYADAFDADGMTANIRDAMAGLAPHDDDDDGYAPRPTANPRRLDPGNMEEAVDEKSALKSAQAAAKFMIRNLDDRAALKYYSMHFWSPEKFYQGATMAMRGAGHDEIVRHITQDRPAQFEQDQKPEFGEFPPKQEITIVSPKKLKSGETYQDRNKYWQSQGQAPIYKTNEGVAEGAMSNLHADLADVYNRMAPGIERNRDSFKAGQLYDALEAVAEQHGAEAEFKRMMNGARNRAHMDYDTNPGGFQNWFWYLPFEDQDVTEGLMKEPTNREEYLDQRDKLFRMMAVDSNPANKQIIKQALQDLEARYGNLKKAVKEESSTSSEAVERAILNRIMVAHTDLLMKYGPEKVMQAAEEVAYNVGDVDEIGTSDVSAYVHQVKQILGVPEEVNEKWSQKYKSTINCANPKGFSQKAHCAGRKK
jgi:hypothetical protein